jgi:Tfp pilus assembly protein PilP
MLDKRDLSVFSLPLIVCLLLTACAGNTVKDDNNDEDDISEITHTPKKELRHIPKAGPLIKVSYQPQTTAISSILKPHHSVRKFKKVNYIQEDRKIRRAKHDTWDRIFNRFRLGNHSKNPRVQTIIKEYARKPKKLAIITRRASPYLYMIVSEVERRGMPAEIALLPFVESGFNPKAYSHSGAAGLWQFIPSTGKLYGLPRNHQFDARLDSFAATHAALNYLQKLHRQFKGDWLH